MRWINAERKVHMQVYDDEHEEFSVKYMTVEELLDEFTDEGCPTIISDPVQHGRWASDMAGNWCSVCGEISDCYFETNYCPNCGAKMDEVEE